MSSSGAYRRDRASRIGSPEDLDPKIHWAWPVRIAYGFVVRRHDFARSLERDRVAGLDVYQCGRGLWRGFWFGHRLRLRRGNGLAPALRQYLHRIPHHPPYRRGPAVT
jgi:hypothetical protein